MSECEVSSTPVPDGVCEEVILRVEATQAAGEQLEVIRWIDRVCFPDEPISFDGAYWWLGYYEDTPVSFAGLVYFPNATAFLSRVGVLPGWRGHGLQRRFIRAREREAKKHGFERMVTYTSEENVISSNNMIKSGYTLYTPPYEWGVKHGLYWQRAI